MLRPLGLWFCSVFGQSRRESARVNVRVGVSYKADPDRVRALLEAAARSCNLLRSFPKAVSSFDDFGMNALEFSVSAMAAENVDPAAAASDLRTLILRSFRAEGIEMPYAQHDVHLRDLDGFRGMLTRMAEQRAAREMEAPAGNDGPQSSR